MSGSCRRQPGARPRPADPRIIARANRFETSAKTGANVEKAVNFLVAEILQNDKANQDRDANTGGTATVSVGGAAPAEGVRRVLCCAHSVAASSPFSTFWKSKSDLCSPQDCAC